MKYSRVHLLDDAQRIAVAAGKAALEFYGQPLTVAEKPDLSPLTQADQASHLLIVTRLADLTPDIPVVSEESADSAAISCTADQWRWLVDPLDGTKEFIKRTGQFTVNIALVCGDFPVLGVVYVPVSGTTYAGLADPDQTTAWTQAAEGPRQSIHVREADLNRLTVVASRDHAGPVVEGFLQRLQGVSVTSMGSSLKFCLVAHGLADFYPRVVPTMQWDTAAAQAVLEAAGGHLTDLAGTRLAYRKEQLRNPSIMAFGDPQIDWVRFFAN